MAISTGSQSVLLCLKMNPAVKQLATYLVTSKVPSFKIEPIYIEECEAEEISAQKCPRVQISVGISLLVSG